MFAGSAPENRLFSAMKLFSPGAEDGRAPENRLFPISIRVMLEALKSR